MILQHPFAVFVDVGNAGSIVNRVFFVVEIHAP